MPSRNAAVITCLIAAVALICCLFSCKSEETTPLVPYQPPYMPEDMWQVAEEPPGIKRIKRVLNTTTLTLAVEEASLDTVADILMEKTGLRIEIDYDIDSRVPLTLRLRDIVLKNALQLIMDQTGYTYVIRGNVIFITPRGSWAQKEYLEDRHGIIVERRQSDFEIAFNTGRRLFESREYEDAKKHFEQLLMRIYSLPRRLELDKDYENLCEQAIRECDRRLRDQIIKERDRKEEY